MIGNRVNDRRGVSGEGGSCLYRSVAYQLCERTGRPYDDKAEVANLRNRVNLYLKRHANCPVPTNRTLKWSDLGSYPDGYAEAPVPQVIPYVVRCPLEVRMGSLSFIYGADMPGKPVYVRLHHQHYSIEYPSSLERPLESGMQQSTANRTGLIRTV